RVRAAAVIGALDLARAQIELNAPQERRMGIGLEVGVDEVRDLVGMAVEVDGVGAVDLAPISVGAALVDAGQGVQRFQRAAMDIQRVWQQLADCRQASWASASPARKSRSSV